MGVADGADRHSILQHDIAQGTYKRLIVQADRLVGCVLYGDTSDGGYFFGNIQSGVDISPMRETLLFGPDYAASKTPMPPDASRETEHSPPPTLGQSPRKGGRHRALANAS